MTRIQKELTGRKKAKAALSGTPMIGVDTNPIEISSNTPSVMNSSSSAKREIIVPQVQPRVTKRKSDREINRASFRSFCQVCLFDVEAHIEKDEEDPLDDEEGGGAVIQPEDKQCR